MRASALSLCLSVNLGHPDSAASGGSALLNLDFFGPVEDSGSTSSASMPGQHLLLLILPLLHLTCNLHQTSTQFHFLFSSLRLLKVQLLFVATRWRHLVLTGLLTLLCVEVKLRHDEFVCRCSGCDEGFRLLSTRNTNKGAN